MRWAAAAVVLLSLGLGAVRQGLFVLPPAAAVALVASRPPAAGQLLITAQADGTRTRPVRTRTVAAPCPGTARTLKLVPSTVVSTASVSTRKGWPAS